MVVATDAPPDFMRPWKVSDVSRLFISVGFFLYGVISTDTETSFSFFSAAKGPTLMSSCGSFLLDSSGSSTSFWILVMEVSLSRLE